MNLIADDADRNEEGRRRGEEDSQGKMAISSTTMMRKDEEEDENSETPRSSGILLVLGRHHMHKGGISFRARSSSPFSAWQQHLALLSAAIRAGQEPCSNPPMRLLPLRHRLHLANRARKNTVMHDFYSRNESLPIKAASFPASSAHAKPERKKVPREATPIARE